MIEPDSGPIGINMTGFASIGCLEMGRTLAGRGRPIMTTETGTRNTGVIKVHRGPVSGDMAVLASIGCLEMGRALAGRGRPIMTTRTGTRDPGMIKTRCTPALSVMTGFTLVRGFRMFRAFPYRINIVVATETRSGYRVMIDPKYGCPGLSRVTIGALVICLNMGRALWR